MDLAQMFEPGAGDAELGGPVGQVDADDVLQAGVA